MIIGRISPETQSIIFARGAYPAQSMPGQFDPLRVVCNEDGVLTDELLTIALATRGLVFTHRRPEFGEVYVYDAATLLAAIEREMQD